MFMKDAWRPLYPFESQWMYLPTSHRLHYLDSGEGEPIVALHGNPTWSFYYRELVKEFEKTNRVVVPDHIGCGLSDKPQDYPYTLKQHIDNFEAFVKKLELEPFNLVVHDWGGAIGFGYAVRHPEMVKRILVLNTAAYRHNKMPFALKIARMPFLGEFLVRGLNAFALGAALTSSHRPLGAYTISGYLYPYDSWRNRVGVYRFVKDIPMKPEDPSYATLKEIEEGLPALAEKPMSFVWGAKDFVFDDRFFNRWKQIYPNAEFTRITDAGHYVMEDASVRVFRKLHALLEK